LAQRLAEEEEQKRLKEATWKLAVPLFSTVLWPDAEFGIVDYTHRILDAALPGLGQKAVDMEKDFQNFVLKNVGDDSSSEFLKLSLKKSPRKVVDRQNEEFIFCPFNEELKQPEEEQHGEDIITDVKI
jgi:hypothetical protein